MAEVLESHNGLIPAQQLYLKLRAEKAEAEESLKAINQRLDELQANLAEQMAAIGQTSTTVDGQRLVVRTTPRVSRASGVSAEDLCEALSHTEFDFLVKPAINANSLQAAMKEVIEETGSLPPAVAPLLKVWQQTVVAVSKV